MKYRTRTRQLRLTVIAAAIAAGWSGAPARAAGDQPVVTAPPQIVEIIGVTPLPGLGVSRDKIPSNVQSLNSGEVNGTDSANLPDALNRRLGSVFVNEIQGNPFQPDINYRGFTASPLLGTQQGLSVYLDGVRLNQPFGDVVSWDLIPRAAISTLNLMPGSNPVFGLNTLGGAISIRTKDGLHDAGTSVQVLAGRYDRQEVTVEHGGHNSQGLHWYVTGNGFREDGWRDASPTRLGQVFGKVGWADSRSDVSLSAAYANTKLTGNGLQEQRLLSRDLRQHLHLAGPDQEPFPVLQPGGQACAQRRYPAVRQRLLPAHPHGHPERRHERRLLRPVGLPAERGRTGGIDRGRLYGLPDQRRDGGEYAVPVLALHRQRAAARTSRPRSATAC
jgi:hypothetical protein